MRSQTLEGKKPLKAISQLHMQAKAVVLPQLTTPPPAAVRVREHLGLADHIPALYYLLSKTLLGCPAHLSFPKLSCPKMRKLVQHGSIFSLSLPPPPLLSLSCSHSAKLLILLNVFFFFSRSRFLGRHHPLFRQEKGVPKRRGARSELFGVWAESGFPFPDSS